MLASIGEVKRLCKRFHAVICGLACVRDREDSPLAAAM